jgi:hypothetical protein
VLGIVIFVVVTVASGIKDIVIVVFYVEVFCITREVRSN